MADKTEEILANAPTVMVVDDEEYIRSSLSKMLRKDGYEPVTASSGEEALEIIKSRPVDVMLCDYRLAGVNGIETIVEAKKLLPDMASALITGMGTEQVIIDAFTKGRVDYYLMKPFTLHELTRVINMSLRAADVRKRERVFNEELRKKVDEATKELREKNRLLVVRERELALLNRMLNDDHERLKGLNERLETLSITDELTGLYNFRHFTHALMDEMIRAKRYGLRLSLLMMDLDNFKIVNDQRGHLGGDEALRQVAKMLQESGRSTDVAARYGGEEFTVILPEVGMESAAFRAERLRQALSEIVVESEGSRFSVTMSIGVATFDPEKMKSTHELISAADQALYHAKRIGKNCVVMNRDGGFDAVGKENIMTESQRDDIHNALARFARKANNAGEVTGFLLERLKDVFSAGGAEPFLSLRIADSGGAMVERARIGSYRDSVDIDGLALRVFASNSVMEDGAGSGLVTAFPMRISNKDEVESVMGVLLMNRSPSYPPYILMLLGNLAEIVEKMEDNARLKAELSGMAALDGALRELVGETVKNGLDKAFGVVGGRIREVMGIKAISIYLRGGVEGGFTLRLRSMSGDAQEGHVISLEKHAIANALKVYAKSGPAIYPQGAAEEPLKKMAGEVIIIPLADGEPLSGLLAFTGQMDGAFSGVRTRMGERLAATLSALLHNGPV